MVGRMLSLKREAGILPRSGCGGVDWFKGKDLEYIRFGCARYVGEY